MKKDNKRQPTFLPLQADALATVNGGATWAQSTWGSQGWRWWQ